MKEPCEKHGFFCAKPKKFIWKHINNINYFIYLYQQNTKH